MHYDKIKYFTEIADSNFKVGNYVDALENYLKALEYDKNNIELIPKLGDTYFNLKKFNDAIKCYELILDRSTNSAMLDNIYNSIGNVYVSQENYSSAITFFQKAIELNPEKVHYYKNLQNAVKEKKAEYKSNRITSLELKKAVKRANDFYRIGNLEQVKLNLKKIFRIDPNNQEALRLQAELKVKHGIKEKDLPKEEVDNENTSSKNSYSQRKNDNIDKMLLELDNLVGLENIKQDIKNLINQVKIEQIRSARGLGSPIFSYHSVFIGPPGTGKTTIARKLGQLYKEIGILKEGHLVEVDKSKLVAEYVGQTAIKTNQVIDQALNGILFIDEAYTLSNEESGGYGKEAIDTLLKRMEDDRNRLMVIVAGYPDEMEQFISSNPGLESRFNKYFKFESYKTEELLEILDNIFVDNSYLISNNNIKLLSGFIQGKIEEKGKSFGNARFIRNLFEELVKIHSNRISKNNEISDVELTTISSDDVLLFLKVNHTSTEENIDIHLDELNRLIGLKNVKAEVKSLINFISVEKERQKFGLQNSNLSLHSVFYGAPGTGKTTVARLLSKIFKQLGLLTKGHLVEVDKSDLVAEYVGQTSTKTSKVIDSALGGILFIDEAYTLADTNYGQEAIDTLLKRMEDLRDKLIVIVAGYRNEMQQFISMNPGLSSRFNRYFLFEHFNSNELIQIFYLLADNKEYIVTPEGHTILSTHFKELELRKQIDFGNGRYVRNLFELTLQELSNRISLKKEILKSDLIHITKDDLLNAINRIDTQKIK